MKIDVILVIVGCFSLIVGLVIFYQLSKFLKLWIQALLSGARIAMPHIVFMIMRRSPVKQIIESKIIAAQAGLPITLNQIESAALRGADVELMVRAMIEARNTEMDLSWEEMIEHQNREWLKNKLDL